MTISVYALALSVLNVILSGFFLQFSKRNSKLEQSLLTTLLLSIIVGVMAIFSIALLEVLN